MVLTLSKFLNFAQHLKLPCSQLIGTNSFVKCTVHFMTLLTHDIMDGGDLKDKRKKHPDKGYVL